MNIKTITTGFLVLTLTIGGILVKENFNTEKSVYTPRSIYNGGVSGQAGYAEYMMLLKADPATGKIDYNLVNQVRNEVMARSKQNNKAAIGLNNSFTLFSWDFICSRKNFAKHRIPLPHISTKLPSELQ